MEVDEAGRDDVARRVDDPAPAERCLGHDGDASAGDAHVPDGVEPGRGVHHAPVGDDEVVRRRLRTRGGGERDQQNHRGSPAHRFLQRR
jgi:hypothetical protein